MAMPRATLRGARPPADSPRDETAPPAARSLVVLGPSRASDRDALARALGDRAEVAAAEDLDALARIVRDTSARVVLVVGPGEHDELPEGLVVLIVGAELPTVAEDVPSVATNLAILLGDSR